MIDDEPVYVEAANPIEAFIDCARYDDPGDADELCTFLSDTPSLVNSQDGQGRTALHMAAANGRLEVLEMLLGFNPTPDLPNNEGNTALHFAALNNQVAAAEMLLKHGWKVSARNAFNKTPVQLIYGRQFEGMELLLLAHDEEVEHFSAPVKPTAHVAEERSHTAAPQQIPVESRCMRTVGQLATDPADTESSSDPTALLGPAGVDDIE